MMRKTIMTVAAFIFSLWAACADTVEYNLVWRGVRTWSDSFHTVRTIGLDNAVYPDQTGMPVLMWEIASPDVDVADVRHAPLTYEEEEVVRHAGMAYNPVPQWSVVSAADRKRTKHYLRMNPFISVDGKVRKVTAFRVVPSEGTAAVKSSPDEESKTERYAASSVLASGDWVKIRVGQTGIYKLTYEQIKNMGFASPANVRVHGYGGAMLPESFSEPYTDDLPEVSVYMYKGSDGVFGPGDYILFYGQGPVSWKYDGATRLYAHTRNVYSDYGYYFVTAGDNEGLRVEETDGESATGGLTATSFTDYYVHEKDSISLINSGKIFWGEAFRSPRLSYSFTPSIPNIMAEKATMVIDAVGTYSTSTDISANVNGTEIGCLTIPAKPVSDLSVSGKIATGTYTFTPNAGNSLPIKLTYSSSSGTAYLNYFEVNLKRKLVKNSGSPLFFRIIDYVGKTDAGVEVLVDGVEGDVQIWDITDKSAVRRMPLEKSGAAGSFSADLSEVREFVAVSPSADSFMTPDIIGRVPNQNLHGLGQMDMVIIAHPDFVSDANRLAEWHSSYDGMNAVVVEAETVYNEFSSGTPDATAYRRFMKMFYDRAKGEDDGPKYLILFGDGCFDNRQITRDRNASGEIFRLLTYQSDNSLSETASYTTDDYFALLDDNEGNAIEAELMDICVGRIPAGTEEQARSAVDKILGYLNNEVVGNWKNQILFIADDGDGNQHMESADTVANLAQAMYPDIIVKKMFLDAYVQEVAASGESYPVAKREFDDYIKFGIAMVNYMGHGSYEGWANERILTMDDMTGMYNECLPFWVTATCGFTRFDSYVNSGGEVLMMNANGGAMGLFSTSRTVYAGPNENINLQLMRNMMTRDDEGVTITLGEAARRAKNALPGDANRMSFIFIGDPAVRLAVPYSHKVTIDSINGLPAEPSRQDTIGALDIVTLSGYIKKYGGDYDPSFNGYAHVSVFDKESEVTTLCNDAGSTPFAFKYRSSLLFSGKAEVKDGRFTIQFQIPKDIRYNYGPGKIVVYAVDEENNYEANGSYADICVGGEADDAGYENKGPEIRMYLNTPQFTNGGKVNSSPLFVANVSDDSGINTVGSGIGHDIVMIIDDDPKQQYVLNHYFEPETGNYKEGTVTYQLSGLAEGKHKLFFRVWDIQNNSSSAELEFEVDPDYAPELYDVYVYPNPVVNDANFVCVHDRPQTPVNVTVSVYDLAGRMLWTSGKTLLTDSSNRTTVTWNIRSDGGLNAVDGIYLARVVFEDSDGLKSARTVKLIVRAQ